MSGLHNRGRLLVLAAGLLITLTGCGGGSDVPRTVPVTGSVTLDGNPLPQATVLLIPTGTGGDAATCLTDESGKYNLISGAFIGVRPGNYKVTIQHYVQPDGKPVIPGPGVDLEQLKIAGQVVPSLPLKYSDPGMTELTLVVNDGDAIVQDWKLTSMQ